MLENACRDRSVISAAWGQGQGVVSGMVEADQYVWSHAGYELEAHVVDKDLQLLADPSGQPGLVEHAVPDAMRGVRCLKPSRLAELGAEVTRLMHCFGTPLDIEWTIAEGRLHILQARPITALPPAPH